MGKIDWQWPAAIVFAVTFAVLGALVYAGKLHAEVLLGILTWLAPSPYQVKKDPAASIPITYVEIGKGGASGSSSESSQ